MEELMNNEVVNNAVEETVETVVEAVEPVEVVDVVKNTSGKEVIYAAIGAGAMAAGYGVYRGARYAWNKWGKPKYQEVKEKRAAKKQAKLGKSNENAEDRYVVDDEEFDEDEE